MHTDALPFHPRRRQGLCCRTEQALGTVGGGDCCGLHFSRPTAECVRPAQSTERSGLLRVPEPGETVSPLPGQLRSSLFRTGSLEWLACHPRPRFGFLRPLMKSSPQEVSDLLKICWSRQHPEGNVAAMIYGFDDRPPTPAHRKAGVNHRKALYCPLDSAKLARLGSDEQ